MASSTKPKRVNSVNILGKKYKVKYQDLTSTDACAYTDNAAGLIVVDKNLKGNDLKQTLLHEFFHGVMHRTGVNQTLDPRIEEIIVESISVFLVDTYDFDLE